VLSPLLPIDTDRLRLRCFSSDDLNDVMAYHALPEAQRYLDRKSRDDRDVKAAHEAMRTQISLNRPGDTLALAVERLSDGKLVGQVLVRWHDATAAQAELTFAFNPIFRRQNYPVEALKAAIELGFSGYHFHRIFVRCDARNQSSAHLLEGLGMRLEAHYREHALFEGEWDEELLFAILDREWRRPQMVRDIRTHKVA
jgi:RimJ/RimL family protein N-acetyltransferase